ncbi:hypothetical protein ACIBJF_26835 [Streptomyces sp. NPDC050743]|uniref:hypothetical protein n=1 Tax=Streptomyces sp. NPDC050743 TaxID=3365634 RepID=UPI00378B2D89
MGQPPAHPARLPGRTGDRLRARAALGVVRLPRRAGHTDPEQRTVTLLTCVDGLVFAGW